MGLVAILTFAAFGLIPITGIILALESWGLSNAAPWIFALSPRAIRTEKMVQRVLPTHRDGRVLRGELISLRLLTDGRCFFVPSDRRDFLRLCGVIHWPGHASQATVIGKLSLGSVCMVLSILFYGLFALILGLVSARSGPGVLVGGFIGLAGITAIVLGSVFAAKGLRAKLDRLMKEADALIQLDSQF